MEPWALLAQRRGLMVSAPEPGADVVVSGAGFTRTAYLVHRRARPLRPGDVDGYVVDGPDASLQALVLATGASQAALEAARAAGVSVIVVPTREDDEPTGVLVAADGSSVELASPGPAAQAPGRPGPPPWSLYDAAFTLLEGPVPTQSALAARVGVSQARISQVLRELRHLVERTADGWSARDRSLAEWLAREYPQADRVHSTWASVVPVADLTTRVVSAATDLGLRHAIGGDAAADLVGPWARPADLVVWADRMWDLRPIGLVPAPPSAAQVTLRVPMDPYRLRRTVVRDGITVVSPWRLWVDLVQAEHEDAAAGLWRHLSRKEPHG